MIKLKFNRATTWIGFILINMLAISCSCGETPEEKQKKELLAQEKKLIKEGLEAYKKVLNYNFSPEEEKGLNKAREEQFRIIKEQASLEQLNEIIKNYEKYIKVLESGDDIQKKVLISTFNLAFKEILSAVKSEIPNFPSNLKIKFDADTLKQILLVDLAVLNNLKQQLELKNKGKKSGDKKRSGEK